MASPSPIGESKQPFLGRNSNVLTPNQAKFLAAYEQTGGIHLAARMAGVNRNNHAQWLRDSPVYAEAFQESYHVAIEKMELELRRRSLEGIQEPVVYKGAFSYPLGPDGQPDKSQKPLSITRYSDSLLMFALKANLPEKYKDRSEITSKWDGDVTKLDRDQLKKLAESLASMAFGGDAGLLEAAKQELEPGVIDVTAEPETATSDDHAEPKPPEF